MALIKIRLGDYINLYSEKCNNPNLTIWDISGVNRDKEFFEPSKQAGADTSKYKVVPPGYFACNLMHVGRDMVLPIALNHTESNKIVSPAYTVFNIKNDAPILKEYFFIMLKSSERDRYFWFHTDSSVRDGMSWDDFCDLEISIPPLSVQQKYVDIYNSMLANQRCYERGLEDLQVICDAHFDRAKKERTIQLREVLERVNVRNADGSLGEGSVRGISNKKEFSNTKADVANKDLSKFIVVKKGEFAFNTRTDGRDMLVLALNREERPIIVTWNYNAFRIRSDALSTIIPEYLYSFLKRSEFDRRVRFMSWGSTQELFSWDSLCDVYVPIPPIEVQRSIANITEVFTARKSINERLKAQIKGICPILVKGAVEEGAKNEF